MMLKTKKILPVGFWQRDNLVDVAWIERPKQAQKHPHLPYKPRPTCITLSVEPKSTLVNRVLEKMVKVPNPKKVQMLFISAVQPNCVWERAIVVPEKNLTEEQCRQHCETLFKSELPVSMDEIWFDFHYENLAQGTLIEMSAVLIEKANERRFGLSPVPIQIMDSASHALIRAFQYFEENLPKETIYIYVDDDYSVVLQEKGYNFNVLQVSDTEPKAVLEQFVTRYPGDVEKVCIHTKNENDDINEFIEQQENWVQIKTTQPFIAFGLALWNLS